jgi:hypothetical protein
MKKLTVLGMILLGCLCFAQDTGADYPSGLRIIFGDGTAVQLACTQDGNCRVIKSTSASNVTRINLGFSAKHGYILNVQ